MFETEIFFSKHPIPSISLIVREMECVSGLEVEWKELDSKSVIPGAKGFRILNDPNSHSVIVVYESNMIIIICEYLDLGYFEGIISNILIRKFNGEGTEKMFLPSWTEEAWKGLRWWKKCKKRPSIPMVKKIKMFYMFVKDCFTGS
ncbi:hypothetical protein [Sporocytophaga myxococcoides]|uniref:hypothetical protein n=1 Tax=Sporocytophaga myxococcoides TaxID=153721 RepID=UPI0004913CC2|nr:hypothetical protein [Sporocytophaga myxococcoides]